MEKKYSLPEERRDIKSFRRIMELIENPIKGQFDLEHLKKLNAYIFQDTPEVAGKFRDEIKAESGEVWVKNRSFPDWGTSLVGYSNMGQSDIQQAETTLNKINISYLRILDKTELAKEMSTLYAKLDQLHPFPDGNSRTLREFTRTLALEAGYDLNWGKHSRETIYAARDVAVNSITIEKLQGNDKQIWAVARLSQEIHDLKTYPGYKPLEKVIQDSLSISKQLDPKARYEQLKKGILAGKELNTEIKITDKGLDK